MQADMRLGNCLILAALVLLAPRVRADASASPEQHARVELISLFDSISPADRSTWVALKFTIDPGWHLYWVNPGESGIPPTVKWTLPEGFSAGPLLFPTPHRITDPSGSRIFGYESELVLPVKISWTDSPSEFDTIEIKADVSWLVCREVCLAESGPAAVSLPVKSKPVETIHAPDITAWLEQVPVEQPADEQTSAVFENDRFVWRFELPAGVDRFEIFPLPPEGAILDLETRQTGRRVEVIGRPSGAFSDGDLFSIVAAYDGPLGRRGVALPGVTASK